MAEEALETPFPKFAPVRLQTPIVSNEMTIWPGPKETKWQWVVGFPYELHPFAWDYMWLSSDGESIRIKPHYRYSTWDTFWTRPDGHVKAVGLGGLFPFTLGKEVNLLRGIVATLEAAGPKVAEFDPDAGTKIEQIHQILKTREDPPAPEIIQTQGVRHRIGKHFWHSLNTHGLSGLWIQIFSLAIWMQVEEGHVVCWAGAGSHKMHQA